MPKIVLGKPAVLSQLDDENGQLTYKGQVIGTAPESGNTAPVPVGETNIAVVSDFTELDASAPAGTLAVAQNTYMRTVPVVLPETEETEEGYDNRTLLSNKRISLADEIPYNEAAFDRYLQYVLSHPYYNYDYVWEESAVYHVSDGYQYMRRRESLTREYDPREFEPVTDLQEGDSVYGLYRVTGKEYYFEPWAEIEDSWSDDDKYIAIAAAYITDPVNNTADELGLDVDLIFYVPGATTKYAIVVEIDDSFFPFQKMSGNRYRHLGSFIYAFEDLTLAVENTVLQIRKGWNAGYHICSYDEQYDEYEMRSVEAVPIDSISDLLHFYTKTDGCAACEDGAFELLAGVFTEVAEENPAGLYVKQDQWKCVGSDYSGAVSDLQKQSHSHDNTDVLRRFDDRDGRLRYDGSPLGGRRITNFQYAYQEGDYDVYHMNIVEDYGWEHQEEIRFLRGRNGTDARQSYIHVRYTSSLSENHVLMDEPSDVDDMMGFYIGDSDVAPVDFESYKWFRFRKLSAMSFQQIQHYVRQGKILEHLDIGDVIFVQHQQYGNIPLQVIGVDQDKPMDEEHPHSLTLMSLYPVCRKYFDAPEPDSSNNGHFYQGNPIWRYSNIRKWLNGGSYDWYYPDDMDYYIKASRYELTVMYMNCWEDHVIPGRMYFERNADGTGYSRVTPEPDAVPSDRGWLYRDNTLIRSMDADFIEGKQYYGYLTELGDTTFMPHTKEEFIQVFENRGKDSITPRNCPVMEERVYYRETDEGEYEPLTLEQVDEIFMQSEDFRNESLYMHFSVVDAAPEYQYEPGFYSGLPSDFRAVLGSVWKPTRYNTETFFDQTAEDPNAEAYTCRIETEDTIFLLSEGEIGTYGPVDGLGEDHRDPYAIFAGGYDSSACVNPKAVRYVSQEYTIPIYWLTRTNSYESTLTEIGSSGYPTSEPASGHSFIFPAMCIV